MVSSKEHGEPHLIMRGELRAASLHRTCTTIGARVRDSVSPELHSILESRWDSASRPLKWHPSVQSTSDTGR
jgi:hypothetical protein